MASVPQLNPSGNSVGASVRAFMGDLQVAWQDLWRVLFVRWLWPKLPVRLWMPDRTVVLSKGMVAQKQSHQRDVSKAGFDAILLPEGVLLRHTFNLPKMSEQDLRAAIKLEVVRVAPFSAENAVWTYSVGASEQEAGCVDLVLTSRGLIQQHTDAMRLPAMRLPPEIWARSGVDNQFLMLPGFGGERHKRSLTWFGIHVVMLLCACLLALGMLMTPSARLYLTAVQANAQAAEIHNGASALIRQRENLLSTNEKLDDLSKIATKNVSILSILKLISQTLPDDSYVAAIKIEGAKVTMSGQTPNASALMKLLGSTPGFKEVIAPAPAVKPLGSARELFTIEFNLDPSQLKDR